MGLRRGKPPEAVCELSGEQVERWREGDETVWAERKPGLVDRLTMPGVEVIRDPRLLAEIETEARADREAGLNSEAEPD